MGTIFSRTSLVPIPVTLTPGTPVTTTVPQLLVAGLAKAGTYTFSLVVEDVNGIQSHAATTVVQVTAAAVIR